MASLKLLVVSVACLCAHALAHGLVFPQNYEIPVGRNTIFGDEKLVGEIFEKLDSTTEVAAFTEGFNAYRLPLTTKPTHYDVLWAINIADLSFSGSVDITLQSTLPNCSEIVIHAHDLNILTLSLRQGNTNIPVTYVLEPEYHFLRVRLTNTVLAFNSENPVSYTLSISFSAVLRDDMYGIYKSWFRNVFTENVRWMASTQFQATAARFAFPCYDEPSFKSTFAITIRRPTAFSSWSCMRISETRNSTFQGQQEDVYYTTPIMSTYLLALIVAEYDSIRYPANENSPLMFEVIARPSAIATGQGQYAFEVGQELLAEMSSHTGYDFFSQDPNIKMTQAAIPDFGAGAMENWGLLTYREAYLLYDQNHTNSYFKQLIAYILSHEIAHMWFGNLVTCDWWDVLWLNEGFARYYQYFLTHWVEDYMGLETRFIIEQMHTSLLSDSVNSPQPLSNPGIGSPASVSSMFSTITYNKGAAVIRMTEHLMGSDIHRAGLRNYLRNLAFQTAIPEMLFDSLEVAGISANAFSAYGSDFSLPEYYKSWTEQPGHPVLNVQVNHQTGEMLLYQRRFNINTGYSTVNTNYIIPITFSTASNPDFVNTKPSHVIRKAVTSINRGSVGDEWVIFNRQQTGFYRVNYDDYTWDLIIIALRGQDRTLIHEYNRAQIVNDVFSFARSGLMSYTRAFNILSFLENETEYAPWVAAMTGFSWIRNRLAGTTHLTQLEALIARWATTVMNRITYYPIANETYMQSYLRWQLAPVMCNINVAACRTAAVAQFTQLITNGIEVPVDSRNWVYCNALRQGSTVDFNFLWTRFQQHNVYTEKIQLLMVLGCTPHSTSLYTFLDAIINENNVVRPQDYTTAFNSAVTGNEANTQIVFQYIQSNLQNVINAFGSATTPLSYISSRLRTVAEIDAFQSWATANQASLNNQYQAVFNGAETSRDSIAWAAAVQNDMNTYFQNGNDNIVVTPPTIVTTPAPVVTPVPTLVEPTTPALADVPGSAFTTFASVLLIAVAVIANFLF